MKTRYKWAAINKRILRGIAMILRDTYKVNNASPRVKSKTTKGATHKVRASGLGGWTRKMNRARAMA
jgi:hypothetical protein